MNPPHPHALYVHGLIKARVAEYDAATQILERCVKACDDLPPEKEDPHLQLKVEVLEQLAHAYERQRDYAQALRCVDAALQIDDTHCQSYCTKGLVSIQKKQFGEAVRLYEKAARLDGACVRALVYF